MASIARSALVEFSAQQMFDLINDIETYPEFMSGCLEADVLERGEDFITARLTLGKSGFQQSFVTRNELQPPELMVMRFQEGPFSHFEGRWSFQVLSDNACKVSLDLEFEFNNPVLAMTVGSWFEKMANQQVDALCERAAKVYEKHN